MRGELFEGEGEIRVEDLLSVRTVEGEWGEEGRGGGGGAREGG